MPAIDRLCVKAICFSFLFLPDFCKTCPYAFPPNLISFSPAAFISLLFYSTLTRFICEARQGHYRHFWLPSLQWISNWRKKLFAGAERERERKLQAEQYPASLSPTPSSSSWPGTPLLLWTSVSPLAKVLVETCCCQVWGKGPWLSQGTTYGVMWTISEEWRMKIKALGDNSWLHLRKLAEKVITQG